MARVPGPITPNHDRAIGMSTLPTEAGQPFRILVKCANATTLNSVAEMAQYALVFMDSSRCKFADLRVSWPGFLDPDAMHYSYSSGRRPGAPADDGCASPRFLSARLR